MIESPVILLTFNRPDTTRIVFEAIRKARPVKLYVFNDGPRSGNDADVKAREEIKKIINQVDWKCELISYFSDINLGCGLGVSGAITWAFKNEDRLIVLEDDTVPAMPFFSYCCTLLEKYKNDNRICMISGNNYSEEANANDDSYLISKYGHIWGWATWKRVWDKYDYEMKDWPIFKKTNQMRNIFTEKKEQKYFTKYFDNIFLKEIKGTWDFQWFYCRIKECGLSIIPQYNLVTNIGVKGVHTSGKSKAHFKPINENYKISKEPIFVLCNEYYDRYHFKQVINIKRSLIARILRKINKTVIAILKKQ